MLDLLDILKLCATGLGIISGLIGTLTITKDKQTGDVTRWGRKLVAVIVLSGIIAAASQWRESQLKRTADADALQQRLSDETNIKTIIRQATSLQNDLSLERQLSDKQQNELVEQNKTLGKAATGVERNALSTNAALLNTLRLSDPLQDPRFVNLYVTVDYGTVVTRPYFDRLRRIYGSSQGDLTLDKGEASFPSSIDSNERILYVLSTIHSVDIDFTRIDGGARMFRGTCRRTGESDNAILVNLSSRGYISTTCTVSDMKTGYQTATGLESHMDLHKSSVRITLATDFDETFNLEELSQIRKTQMTLTTHITGPNGKVIDLENLPVVQCESLCFGRELKSGDY